MTATSRIEKIPLSVEIHPLWEYVKSQVLSRPPVQRSAAISGWSVLSSDGTYSDGWQNTFLPLNGPMNRNPTWTPRRPEEETLKSMQDFDRPTDICSGPLATLIEDIQRLGLWPRRARIIALSPRSSIAWHVDGPPGSYSVRLHVPLKTNPAAVFEYEDESRHLPADGSAYLLDVARPHRICNESDEVRYHFVSHVWDMKHISQKYRFHSDSPVHILPIDLDIDIARLRDHVERFVLPLESVQQSQDFGGWSILSSNGDYRDGWQQGHLIFKQKTYEESVALYKKLGLNSGECTLPTEICHGYLGEVVDAIRATGLSPSRTRLIRLRAGGKSAWHRDASDSLPTYRLHIPILTNPGCYYECIGCKEHMPASGRAYVIRVNQMHKVVNYGTEDRLHLVTDIVPNETIRKHLL